MTLLKIAKRVTPGHTYYAYVNQKGNYYWRNPFNNCLQPLKKSDLKTWTSLVK
jgi:hypothetical protein